MKSDAAVTPVAGGAAIPGVGSAVSTATSSMGATAPAPPWLADAVMRTYEETDWESFLPARARGRGWRSGQDLKRGIDVIGAALGLLVLSPLLLLVAALVKLSSPGPVLYPWRVLGHRARPFVGYKFRTMVVDAESRKADVLRYNEMTGPVFKMRNDPRVTRLGRWLRKFSVDELPQLWSVLKGDMSLVGPRPPSAEEFAAFETWQRGKLAVRPGITCLWQVNGRSQIADFEQWMELDRKYIEEWSLWLDFRILARTLPAVLRGHGAY